MAQLLTVENLGISPDEWASPELLDAHLVSRGLIRSDAGFPAGESIIATEIREEDRPFLEEIAAALALQRAMICVMTCEEEKPDIITIRKTVDRVESRGYTHETLLRDEVVHSMKRCPTAYAPESVFNYKEGTVLGLLRRALDGMNPNSYGIEACGVANSLLQKGNILDGLNPIIYNVVRASEGQENQPKAYPLDIRNNLAWLERNPHCNAEQVERYLSAYGTTIDELIEKVEALAPAS